MFGFIYTRKFIMKKEVRREYTGYRRIHNGRQDQILIGFIFTLFLLVVSGQVVSAQNSWSELEYRHAVINEIKISVLPVFNLQDPRENHLIGRMANYIHVETQSNSIRTALTFKEGEFVNEIQIRASERLLRSLPFIYDAEIIPSENPDGSVCAVVKVRDAWSLKLSLSMHHIGGETEWGIMAREFNILGLGKQIQLGYEKTIDRTYTNFAYQDPFFFNLPWILFYEYKQLSDGTEWLGMFQHPFYHVRSPWSAGISAASSRSIQTFYDKGKPSYYLPSQQNTFSIFYHLLVWQHDNSAQRLGLEWQASGYKYNHIADSQTIILPNMKDQSRYNQGLIGFWQFFEDDYITRKNINYMNRTEDFNLGWDVQLRVGYFPTSLGSKRNSFYAESNVEKGFALDANSFFTANSSWQIISEKHGLNHVRSQANLCFYDQHLPRQTVMVAFQLIHNTNPYPEEVTYLGGIDGLRGYNNYFRIGKDRWMFTLEDRVYTSWNLLGLVEFGFVVFMDAGAVKDFYTDQWSKSFASVGAGLRIANLKSSFGRIFTVSVATPITGESGVSGLQFVLGMSK